MKTIDWNSIEEQFGVLPLREQLLLLERLMRKMRESAYLDIPPDEAARVFEELASDPNIQRELRMLPPQTNNAAMAKEPA